MIIRYKPYLMFLGLLGLGLLVISLISAGYYPVALADGTFITARDFRDGYGLAAAYSGSFARFADATAAPPPPQPTQGEIQAAVLSQLIEDVLIERQLREEVGDEFDRLVAMKVEKFNNDATLHSAARTLFSASFDDFNRRIVTPQAQRELLTGRLFLRGEKLNTWLENKKKDSRVVVFSGRFYWDGESVKIKK